LSNVAPSWVPFALRVQLGRLRRRGRPIVVYTGGKAGSTSLEIGIRASLRNRPVHKIHTLDPALLDELAIGRRPVPMHVRSSRALRRRPPTAASPWDVIVLVREPLSQSVSAYFQNAEVRGHAIEPVDAAVADYLADRSRVTKQLQWFDLELQSHLGIDIYELPFDHERSALRVDTPAVRLLLLRLEDQDRWAPHVSTFLGAHVDIAERANVADDKAYADSYQRFREEAVLPEDLVDEVLGSRLARHFYTGEELAAARGRWRVADHTL
jgi:hypothetical protein